MRVLVTNDDGVESAGIVALTRALHDAGHDVFVVAPASDLSGAGASIGPLHRSEPIPVAEHHWDDAPGRAVLAIERPPATAVYLACLGAFGAATRRRRVGHQPGREHRSPDPALRHGRRRPHRRAASASRRSPSASSGARRGYLWETAAQIAVPALDWVVRRATVRPGS